jgi:hypothetical protein
VSIKFESPHASESSQRAVQKSTLSKEGVSSETMCGMVQGMIQRSNTSFPDTNRLTCQIEQHTLCYTLTLTLDLAPTTDTVVTVTPLPLPLPSRRLYTYTPSTGGARQWVGSSRANLVIHTLLIFSSNDQRRGSNKAIIRWAFPTHAHHTLATTSDLPLTSVSLQCTVC